MNIEKMVCALIGSLIAGSIIQKNMSLEGPYFLVISAGLWVLCIGTQWWNRKREQQIRDKFENSNLENRDAIVNNIIDAITANGNSIVEAIKAMKNVSVENRECVCNEITTIKDLLDANHRNTITTIVESADRTSKDICSQIDTHSNSIRECFTEKMEFLSKQNVNFASTIESGVKDVIKQIVLLNDALVASKETINGSILDEREAILGNLTKLMNLLGSINDDVKGILSDKSNELFGVLSNLQSVLETTDSRISNIQNTDSSMCNLLEDTNIKLQEIETAIGNGSELIEDAMSQSMERQNEIVIEEQSILDSYNELLGRINDEVIVKLINDSNTLLKCIKDCYNLLDSQRRAKK